MTDAFKVVGVLSLKISIFVRFTHIFLKALRPDFAP